MAGRQFAKAMWNVMLMLVLLFQADACAWLGHWYKDINQNWFKARNCYKRALALQPHSSMIGEHFCCTRTPVASKPCFCALGAGVLPPML